MPRLQVGDIALNYLEHGQGAVNVLAIHGNLGCAQWLDLVLPLLPADLRVIATDWRGCGASDKPEPEPDYGNYRMDVHAQDHLRLLDALGIERCHLYGHSTGGIIIAHLLTLAPERFDQVLLLDPVSPLGLELAPTQLEVLGAMKRDRDACFAGLATAAPTLFQPDTPAAGQMPQFAATASDAQRDLFNRLIDKTRLLSDGIWFGTPHDLGREWHAGDLARRMPDMTQEHLILFGARDYWIPRQHLEVMVDKLPRARLEVFPEVGHSMNLEQPARFARLFGDYFRR